PIGQLFVAFRWRDRDGEGDQIETSPDRFINRPQTRFMVSHNDELELWHILEEVLPHKPGSDFVAPSECLDLALRPSASLLGFDGGNEPCAAKACKIGRVSFSSVVGKGLDRRGAMIVANAAGNGIDECGFTIRACPKEEKQRVLSRH